MKLTRRFLALLLAFSMSLSMVTPAFASEVETIEETEPAVVVEEIAAVEAEAADEAVEDAADESEASEEVSETVYAEEEAYAEGDEEPSSEATEETEPEAGTSQDNPIWPEWQWNDAQTAASVTVTVPAGEIRYVAITFGGLVLTINGGEASETTGNFMMPQILELANDGEEDANYVLNVVVPSGTQSNPEALSELDWIDLSLAEGDQDGYYYTYIAEGTGTATFYFSSVTEGVEADIVLYNENTYAMKTLLEDGVDNNGLEVSIDVNAGDLLNIQVVVLPDENWNIAAADITWVGNFTYVAGTEQNPIYPEFEWNETGATATVIAPVGTTYYGVYGGAGMYMSINGAEPFLLTASNPRMPAVFPITNEGAAEAEYTLVMTYAEGTMENPEVMYGLGGGYTSLEANDGDGHFYTYTVENDGVLEFSIVSVTEGAEADIAVSNESTYAQRSISADGVDGVASMEVNAGDVLTIQVVALPDASWNIPAAEVEWTINYPVGTELNPLFPEFVMNDAWTEGDAVITVPANTTYYCATYSAGMILTINGGEEQLLKAEGMGRVPAYFTVTNDTDADAEYALHLEYPVGNSANPAELSVFVEGESFEETEGQNIATVKEGDWYGYNYSWIAPADGELTITMSNGKAGWFYVINNMTAYVYGDNHFSCNGDAMSETIAVKAGDEISLVINSCGASEYDVTPAGDIYFNVYYAKTVGTESNPVFIEFAMNEEYSEGTATVTVPANTTYYFQSYNVGGMELYVNGVLNQILPTAMRGAPVVFTLTNDTAEDAEWTLSVSHPAGSQMKPAELADGETTVSLAEGTQGYFFSYIAADTGIVTFEIAAAEGMGWTYVINNMTTYHYGDTQWSDSDPVVNPVEISVNKGDELQIIVNTYDAANPWAAPAGDVTVNVSFAPAEGTENLPVNVQFAMNEDYTEGTATVTVPANTTYYFQSYNIGGMILSVNGTETGVLAGGMPMMPITFSVTNDTDADADFALSVKYPAGSMMNPTKVTLGQKTTAEIEDGSQGYFFTWTATGNGVLEFTMNTKTGWTYQLSNDNTYVSTDTHWFDDEKVIKKDYLAVNEGDVVTIMVNTYDPENPWSAPAGKIEFTTKLIVSYNSTLLAGKNMALKYLDPKTGKAVSNSKITWAMDEQYAAYATLKNGTLTAAKTVDKHQQVIVTGTYEGVEQRFIVNIYPAATSVTIYSDGVAADSKTTLNLITNKPETWPVLTAVVASADALNEVTWKSSNTKVVDVVDGVITPVGNKGNVTITATANDGSGKKATVKINVTTEVTSIDITSKTGFNTVGAGKALTLIATTNKDAVNQKVDWSISAGAEYATVKGGKLTANKGLTEMHEVVVVATAMDGSGVTGTYTATVLPIANSVVINDAPATVDLGGWPYAYLGAEVRDAEGNVISGDVTWKSSSDKIATVDAYGTVEFLKAGNVTITATANDGSGKKASVKITAVKSPWMIELPTEAVVAAGKNLTLTANVLDADATNKKLDWTISENDIGAKVSNGKVSSNAKLVTEPTTVTVTATAQLGDGYGWFASASCDVTIYPATTEVSILSYQNAAAGEEIGKTVTLKSGEQIVVEAVTTPANAAGVYTWKSSDEKIATVEQNPDGTVSVKAHALKNGKATITATAADGTGKKASFTVNVTVNAVALEMDRQNVVAGKSVDLSKQIRFLDYDGCAITPANTTVIWTLWERSLIVDENGEPVLSPEGWECYEWNPTADNKCAAGTLNAKTGKFTANKITEYDCVIINAEYVNAEGVTIGFMQGVPVEIYPTAAKGVEVYGCDGEYDEYSFMKLDKQKVTTTENQVILNPQITNWEDWVCWDFEITTDNDAFTVTLEEMEIKFHDENGELVETTSWFYVLRPVNGADPYGTVKVTVKTVDGSNKSTNFTVNFVAP